MIAITPISLEYGTFFDPVGVYDTKNLAIGTVVKVKGIFETDQPLLSGCYGALYLRMGLFLDIGFNPETAPIGIPPLPYLYYLISASTLINTDYPLNFTGNSTYENGSYTIRLDDSMPNIRIIIEGTFLLVEDVNGYPTGIMANMRKLLYNGRTNGALMDNGGSSVFNSDKVMRMAVYFLGQGLSGNNTSNWVLSKNDVTVAFSWYGKDAHNINSTDVINESLVLYRPAVLGMPVTDLTITEPTKAQVKFDTTYNDIYITFFLIRSNGADNSVHFLTAYKYASAEDYTEALQGVPLPENLPAWMSSKIGNPLALTGVSQVATESPANTWTTYFEINPASLNTAYTYRILAVVYFRNNPFLSYDTFSIISNDLQVGSIPSLTPPTCYGTLKDYYNTFGNYLQCAPLERLKTVIRWDGAVFSASRTQYGHTLVANAKTITITLYTLELDLKHIYERVIITKNNQGVWVSSNPNVQVTADVLNDILYLDYTFRVRYEPDKVNLSTVNNLTNIPLTSPQSNQDWTNKNVYIDTQLELLYNTPISFSDVLIKKQILVVGAIDTECLAISFEDTGGNALRNFCDTLPALKARVLQCTDDNLDENPNDPLYNDKFIAGLDKKNYGIANIVEYDPEPEVNLIQLQELPLTNADPEFISSEAVADINALLLESNSTYRFIAIKKKAIDLSAISGVACDGMTQLLDPGETFYKNFNMSGNGDGYILMPFRFFYSPRGLRVVYEDTVRLSTVSGSPYLGGLPGGDPYPAPDLVSGRGAFALAYTDSLFTSPTVETLVVGGLDPYNTSNMYSCLCPQPAKALNEIADVSTNQHGLMAQFLHAFPVDAGVAAGTRTLHVLSLSAPISVYIYQQDDALVNIQMPIATIVTGAPGTFPFAYPGNAGVSMKPLIVVVEGWNINWTLKIT